MPHECTECGRTFDDGSKEMLSGCPACGGTTFQFRPDGEQSEDADGHPEPPDPAVDGVTRTVGNAASAVRDLVGGGRSTSPEGADDRTETASPPGRSDRPSDAGPTETGGVTETTERVPDDTGSDTRDPDDAGSTDGGTDAGSAAGETGSAVEDADPANADRDPTDTVAGDAAGNDRRSAVARDGPAQSDARTDIVEADELPASAEHRSDRPPVPDPRPLSARSDEDTGADDDRTGDTTTDDGTPVGHDDGERPSLSELRAELNDQFESIRVVKPGQYELNLMELYDREEYIVALQEDGKYTVQLPEGWDG